MEIQLRFFANFREAVGQKTISRECPDEATVGEVLQEITEEYPGVDLFDDEGKLREFLSVMKNGREITYLDGLETELDEKDTISVFRPLPGDNQTGGDTKLILPAINYVRVYSLR